MKRLSYKQMRATLAAIDVLHSDIEPETLQERIINAGKVAISYEICCLDVFDNSNQMTKQLGQYPDNTWSPELHELTAQYVYQHPLFTKIVVERQPAPFRLKDHIARSNFHNTIFYNETYRLLAINDQIAFGMNVASDFYVTCCFNRSGKEFSVADCQAVALLETHLKRAIQNSWAIERLRRNEHNLQNAFGEIKSEMVFLDADGAVELMNDSALILLQKYFLIAGAERVKLPEEIELWRKKFAGLSSNGDFFSPPIPLIIKRGESELKITLSINSRTNRQTLLIEEKCERAPKDLMPLNLTKRETEILHRVAQGKTDVEIALICDISARTVQNHLQHIYDKLGVENRTAAALRMFEVLRK